MNTVYKPYTPRFWAKTGRGELGADGQPLYHPVICHLADTAAVAREIVRSYLSSAAIAALEQGLGLSGESLIRFCSFMAGSHDLGKVSPAFQFQVSEVGQRLVGEVLYGCWLEIGKESRDPRQAPHGLVTAATLPDFLVGIGLGAGLPKRKAKRLAQRLGSVVGGHHGFFPAGAELDNLDARLAGTGEGNIWQQHSLEIFQQLQDFVQLQPGDLPDRCDNAAAMILAGLTTVSDWLASNPDNFPYAEEPFETYGAGLEAKAHQALKQQGWQPPATGQPLEFTQLFNFIQAPRPLQSAAIHLAQTLHPPCLVLVEASMGEGKTEAALYVADYLQHQGGAGGFYIGLPTQATSNAMFERVQAFLKGRYADEVVNLTLSHGAAALMGTYQDTVCRLDQVYDEEGRGVFASEWHTARKRTLLSPFGVGTLDQGLMGVVRSRHQFVRLFGLAGRTIILDEIHAYDLYTSTLLERFLEWAAVLGSPVIALSATLPQSTRQALLSAYAKGCGQPVPAVPTAPYPRITALSQGKVVAESFAASDHVCRELGIRWVGEGDWPRMLGAVLKGEGNAGGCVAVICSTVNRAQAVYQALQAYFPPEELGLFHGRFLFRDRERIEQDCLRRFGKGEGERPQRFVLVATQVIEQSLDVDFDLMITDLAPIDLLLQRSGRLHRHTRDRRPVGLEAPTLWIVAPTFSGEGQADFAESGYIYDRHGLLRSWLALRDRPQIALPAEMDSLIEAVYDLERPIPEDLDSVHQEDWQASLQAYRRDAVEGQQAQAGKVKIPPPQGTQIEMEEFTRLRQEDDEAAIAQVTRLGEPSVTTIFLQRTPRGLVLPGSDRVVDLTVFPDLTLIRDLLKCSTRLGKRPVVEALLKQRNPGTWTSALLRHCRYVEVDERGVAVVGGWRLTLDPQRGVLIEEAGSS